MSFRWVLDEDYPGGHLVEMTPAEETQLARDRATSALIAAAQADADASADQKLDALRKARADVASGKVFTSLSEREKKVMDLLIEGLVG